MKLSILAPALVALLSTHPSTSFVPSISIPSFISNTPTLTSIHTTTTTTLHLSSNNDSSSSSSSGSRLQGNARPPTAQEIAIMDEMITKLANAKPYDLPNAVSQAIRVISSPRFFMRIAERTDQTSSDEEKEKLRALAANLVSTVEAVVSTAEDKMDQKALDVESILKCAAEPDSGEFLVPLSAERLASMRQKMTKMDSHRLDEGFLVTVDQWMNKSSQDGMDGMVGILQKVLQIYAAVLLSRARDTLALRVGAAVTGADAAAVEDAKDSSKQTPAAGVLEGLLSVDTDLWEGELRRVFAEGEVSKSALMGEVQRTIEGVVLGLENGSMAQRVQAEFLRELVSRIEKFD